MFISVYGPICPMNPFPRFGLKRFCTLATIILAIVLVNGCIDDINSYSHPHSVSPYSEIHANIEVAFSGYDGSYQVLAVMIPDTWSADACTFSGDYSGSMSLSDTFRQGFENVYPSDGTYGWQVFVSDDILTYVEGSDTFTFDITLTAGDIGQYWLDYRIGSCDVTKNVESTVLAELLGNIYVNVGDCQTTQTSVFVKRQNLSPTFGVLDTSWSDSASVTFENGRDKRFSAQAYFLADQTHLNIFVDVFGCETIVDDGRVFAILFDTNNDGTLTKGIDTAIYVNSTVDNYNIARYNGIYDIFRWDIVGSAALGTPIGVNRGSVLADAAFVPTSLNSAPHTTYSLRIPLTGDIVDRNAGSIRYVAILYDNQVWDLENDSFSDANDVRSYYPAGADSNHVSTWGLMRIGNVSGETWSVSLTLAKSALEQANSSWSCLEPHISLLSGEREALDEIAVHMQNAATLTEPLEASSNARRAILLIEGLIIKYDIDCQPS